MKKDINLLSDFNGGITIFLSLIMLFIFALLGTLIESARVSAANVRLTQSTRISLNSVFSEFAEEVFRDYGIFILWKDESEIIEEINKYLNKNINYKDDFIQKNSDLLGIKIGKIEITDIKYVSNNRGEDLADQIYEYMKYRIAGDAVNLLLDKCNLLSQGEKIQEFFDKVNDCSEKFNEIEESVADIKKKVDQIKEMAVQPKEYLAELKEKLNYIQQIDREPVSSEEESGQRSVKKDQIFEEFKELYTVYKDNCNSLSNCLAEIKSKTDIYDQAVRESAELIQKLYVDLENKKEVIDTEAYEILKNEVRALEAQVSDQNIDAYRVKVNASYVTDYFNKMQLASEKMTQINNNMNGILYNNLMFSQLDANIDYTGCFLSELEEVRLIYENFDIKNLEINYFVEETKKSEDNLLEYIKRIMSDGWLTIITEDISEKTVEDLQLSENLAEVRSNTTIWKDLSYTEQSIRKALMGQYVLDFFHCYTDKNEINKANGILDYEIEYILGGFQNDKENLSYVGKRIVLIREGFNLIYLFKNAACRKEAYMLAVTLVGFTGMPLVIRLTQLLVLGAWAYAESLMDTRDLLNGYGVKLFKSESDWNLSLDSIWRIFDQNSKNKNSNTGLTYKDYLRFLLFIENTGKQTAGIMDMVQININNRYNDSFDIGRCVLGITVKIECRVNRLFTSLAFVKKLISDRRSIFEISSEIIYCY